MTLKLSDFLRQEKAFVEEELGDKMICERCGCCLANYVVRCTAELFESCPGFMSIEDAKDKFKERFDKP